MTDRGQVRIVQPGDEVESYWQPVPANGSVDVVLAPHLVAMAQPFALGTQTVAPHSYIRAHAHDRNEEVIRCLSGRGRAVIDDTAEHEMVPGTTLFLGLNRRHMFINDSDEDLTFLWLLLPNGLEDFFKAIGRPRQEGEPAPPNFARPADVLEIQRRTVFAEPTPDSGKTPQ
jgi:quercetin dioxygenase-like cupin family protein